MPSPLSAFVCSSKMKIRRISPGFSVIEILVVSALSAAAVYFFRDSLGNIFKLSQKVSDDSTVTQIRNDIRLRFDCRETMLAAQSAGGTYIPVKSKTAQIIQVPAGSTHTVMTGLELRASLASHTPAPSHKEVRVEYKKPTDADWKQLFAGIPLVCKNLPPAAYAGCPLEAVTQPDGKLLFLISNGPGPWSAFNPFSILRLNADYTVDTGFGPGTYPGYVEYISPPVIGVGKGTIRVQPWDGKIVVGGSDGGQNLMLVRYLSDGSKDTSFGTGGQAAFNVRTALGWAGGSVPGPQDIVFQPDHRILVTTGINFMGVSKPLVLRLNENGTPDTGFGTGGASAPGPDGYMYRSIALDSGGNLTILGKYGYNELFRYLPTGAFDTTFGTGGQQFLWSDGEGHIDPAGHAHLHQLARLPSGKFVAAGRYHSNFVSVRANSDGTIDSTYGTGGELVLPVAETIGLRQFLLPDGRTVVVGAYVPGAFATTRAFAATRFTASGAVDTSFGASGLASGPLATSYGDISWGSTIDSFGNTITTGCRASGTFPLIIYSPDGVLQP